MFPAKNVSPLNVSRHKTFPPQNVTFPNFLSKILNKNLIFFHLRFLIDILMRINEMVA